MVPDPGSGVRLEGGPKTLMNLQVFLTLMHVWVVLNKLSLLHVQDVLNGLRLMHVQFFLTPRKALRGGILKSIFQRSCQF